MRVSDSVSFSVYMNMFLNIFLNSCSTCVEQSRKSVNNFRTNTFFVIFMICWVLFYLGCPKWSPPPSPSLAPVNVKVPFQGKKYGTNVFPMFFETFMGKLKNGTKMILKWLRRVALFVGWDASIFSPKQFILQRVLGETLVVAPQIVYFGAKAQQKVNVLRGLVLGHHLFFLIPTWCPQNDLGEHSGSTLVENCTPNQTRVPQMIIF